MAATVQQMQADDDAYVKQATDAQNAKQSQEALQGGEKPEPSFVSKFMTSVGRASTNTLDWAVSAADSINVMRDRAAHDIGAGVTTAAVNTADAVGSAITSSGKGLAAAEDPAHAEDAQEGSLPTSPIWDHAKSAILDFRDAVAVKDPTLSDSLLQGGAQLAVPFAGYSRMLAGLHGFANMVAAGAAADATALGPHDPRMADLIALGRHTEGKFGEVLRALAPDGGAVNAYINYLTDRGTGRGELSDLQAAQGSEGTDPATWGKREDGTDKGRGWLGLMRRPDGGVSSELSVSSDINGKETLFPLLVPGLSKDQIQQVLAAKPEESMKIPGVMQVASEFAKQRIASGKSPFAGQDESPTYESEAAGRFKNVLDGFGANMLVTPLLHAVASGLKYGTAGLRHAVENGVGSASDLMPAPQAGRIGSEPMDMSLTPEQRALERERVAAARDREEGVTQEPTPEPIPANAAAREGAAAQRDAADLSPSSPKGWGSADTSTDAQASTLEKDPVLSHTRSFLQSQLQTGQSGSLHAVASTLSSHIDGSTPDGAFYKDLLARISAKNLDAKIVPPGTGTIPAAASAGPKTAGMYSAKTNAITLYGKAFESNERMVHVFTHEAVHAATVKSIVKDPLVKDALQNVIDHVQAHTQGTLAASHYGFTNPKELVAEAESNPKFQEILKNVPDGMGTAWDTYKKIIGGIFGLSGAAIMSPHFDKLLTKEKTGA